MKIPNFLLCDYKKSNKYIYDIIRFSGASASLSESIALSDSIVWRTGDSNFQSTEVLNSLKGFKVLVGPVLLEESKILQKHRAST